GFEGKYYLEYIEQRNKSGDIINFKTEGGESFLDVKARVKQFLEDLKKENYARVLIVAHEAVVIAARVIFNELGDEDSLMTNVKNAEYFMFDL
ncbi:MAG: phosphoglycerate mutase family protein, partial [Nanoarchaeota archaeon]|nr:phosphoglycerate mutase family protein [Nanoarchaeota archaeon]MBU1988325.1 phosphoglycerate mutase family protein [Nanoarchaeota archaeon]